MRKISLIYGILALSVATIDANEFVDSGFHVVIPTKLTNLPVDATHIVFAVWIEGSTGTYHPNFAGITGLGYTLVEPTDQDIIQDVEIPVQRYGNLFDDTTVRLLLAVCSSPPTETNDDGNKLDYEQFMLTNDLAGSAPPCYWSHVPGPGYLRNWDADSYRYDVASLLEMR